MLLGRRRAIARTARERRPATGRQELNPAVRVRRRPARPAHAARPSRSRGREPSWTAQRACAARRPGRGLRRGPLRRLARVPPRRRPAPRRARAPPRGPAQGLAGLRAHFAKETAFRPTRGILHSLSSAEYSTNPSALALPPPRAPRRLEPRSTPGHAPPSRSASAATSRSAMLRTAFPRQRAQGHARR